MSAGTVFCTECGQEISRQAEICPDCGVRNEHAGSTQQSTGVGPESHEWTPLWWLDKKTVAKWGKYYILASLVATAMLIGGVILVVSIIF